MRGMTILLVLVWPSVLTGTDFEKANQFLRDGAIGYGNANFDPATSLRVSVVGRGTPRRYACGTASPSRSSVGWTCGAPPRPWRSSCETWRP